MLSSSIWSHYLLSTIGTSGLHPGCNRVLRPARCIGLSGAPGAAHRKVGRSGDETCILCAEEDDQWVMLDGVHSALPGWMAWLRLLMNTVVMAMAQVKLDIA